MTIDALIMLAGALIAVVSFLGIPVDWHPAIFFVLGVIVIALGVVVRRRGLKNGSMTYKRGETGGLPTWGSSSKPDNEQSE
jgi:hypothetical protein